jgi:hypothetical protein
MFLFRVVARPLGHLTFVVALLALSGAAKLLGEGNQLGLICRRLSDSMWAHPDVTRPGIRIAWLVWVMLLAFAVSPLDPHVSRWDAVVLLALGLAAVWRRLFASRRG